MVRQTSVLKILDYTVRVNTIPFVLLSVPFATLRRHLVAALLYVVLSSSTSSFEVGLRTTAFFGN